MAKAQTKTSSTQTKNEPDILQISIDKLPGIGPTTAGIRDIPKKKVKKSL